MCRSIFTILATALFPFALLGCGNTEDTGYTPPSRVNAVTATKPLTKAEDWCDIYHPSGQAPYLKLPQITDARTGKPFFGVLAGGWTWINLWATWCGPCLREMPMISRWVEALHRDGLKVDLWYLSIDEEGDELASYLRAKPDVAQGISLHLGDQEALHKWLAQAGLPGDTSIPINVLVAPSKEIRCIRTGAINDGHFPVIQQLFRSEASK